jgi:hypothetical protein
MALRAKPQQSKEAEANAFIDQGGSVAGGAAPAKPQKAITFTLRLDAETNDLLDEELASLKGHISKNTWIIHAILQRLESSGRA